MTTFFEPAAKPACVPVVVDWIPGGSHVEITCIATTDLAKRHVVVRPMLPAASAFNGAGFL